MQTLSTAVVIAMIAGSATGQLLPGTPSSPATPATTTQPVTTPPATKTAEPTVEVTSEGAEPRKPLRYTPTKGSSERFEVRIFTRNIMRMDKQSGPSGPSAEVRYECTLAVQDVNAKGEIAVSIVVDKGELVPDETMKPTDRDRVSRAAMAVQTSIVNIRMDARGNVISSEVTKAPAAYATAQLDALKATLTQIAPVLPEAAVGEGASWTSRENEVVNLVTTKTSGYTVNASDNGTTKLAIEFTRRAEKQIVDNPNAPKGSTMELHSLLGAGFGESIRRFDRISPLESDLTIETELEFTVKQPATDKMPAIDQAFGQKMTARAKIKSLDAR
jgi:hypothetical protein